MKRGRRKLKSCKGEDRISSLPDSLIQHILSFLPTTAEAVKTSVLSRRWLHQWTLVPDLVFRFGYLFRSPSDWEIFSKFVDNVLSLHSCSAINKFVIDISFTGGPRDIRSLMSSSFGSWICFATVKRAKEVIFKYSTMNPLHRYDFPQLFYNNSSVVELKTRSCSFIPAANVNVNWESLKVLSLINAKGFTNEIIQNILSGCPSLESLELNGCSEFDRLDNASKCFKRLVLNNIILNRDRGVTDVLSISVPNIEKLELLGFLHFQHLNLMTIPSLKRASLDFFLLWKDGNDDESTIRLRNPFKELLQGVRHASELELGSWFIKILSIMEDKGLSSPFPNCKCLAVNVNYLALDVHRLATFPRLATLLRNFPRLEKLSIDLPAESEEDKPYTAEDLPEKDWMPHRTTPNPLLHLKAVRIIGYCPILLEFVEFLLKNATVLENLFVARACGAETDSLLEASEKLLSLPRSSPDAKIKVELECHSHGVRF